MGSFVYGWYGAAFKSAGFSANLKDLVYDLTGRETFVSGPDIPPAGGPKVEVNSIRTADEVEIGIFDLPLVGKGCPVELLNTIGGLTALENSFRLPVWIRYIPAPIPTARIASIKD